MKQPRKQNVSWLLSVRFDQDKLLPAITLWWKGIYIIKMKIVWPAVRSTDLLQLPRWWMLVETGPGPWVLGTGLTLCSWQCCHRLLTAESEAALAAWIKQSPEKEEFALKHHRFNLMDSRKTSEQSKQTYNSRSLSPDQSNRENPDDSSLITEITAHRPQADESQLLQPTSTQFHSIQINSNKWLFRGSTDFWVFHFPLIPPKQWVCFP